MRNIADAGHDLLNSLSDEELARYGEIARDQASAELSRWWLQGALALGAVAAFVWATAKWGITGLEALGIEAAGFGKAALIGVGIGVVLGYSPYRRMRNWTLWNRHCKAVRAEQERRQIALATGVRVDVDR